MEKKQDKLLFIGADSSARVALAHCKEMGVHTIVTDYLPYEKSYGKQHADEYWMVDIFDTDGLEKRCREEGITGVFAGNNEICLDCAQKLTKRLGFPFYASDEAWATARDKARFKEHCIAVGLDVAKRYAVSLPLTDEMVAAISFPVIVKPVDCAGSKGVTVVQNRQELENAYVYAQSCSGSGNVIVEDYIVGFEFAAHHFVLNGIVYPTSMDDIIYGSRDNGNNMSFTVTPSCLEEKFNRECLDKVQALATRLGVKHGKFYFEIIYSKGKFYFLELIHRIDGVGIWTLTEKMKGINAVKRMVNYALGYPDPDPIPVTGKYHCGSILFYWANPGKVAKIVGEAEVEQMDGVEFVHRKYHVGDEIKQTNDMFQIAFYVSVVAKDREELVVKLKQVTDTLKIFDENGKELTEPNLPFEKIDVFE